MITGFKSGQSTALVGRTTRGSYVIKFGDSYYSDVQPDTFNEPTNLTKDASSAAKFKYIADAISQSKRIVHFEPSLPVPAVERISDRGDRVCY